MLHQPGPQLIIVAPSVAAVARLVNPYHLDLARVWHAWTVREANAMQGQMHAEGVESCIVQVRNVGTLPDVERYQRHDGRRSYPGRHACHHPAPVLGGHQTADLPHDYV